MIKAENLKVEVKGDSCDLAAELAVIVNAVFEEIKEQDGEEHARGMINHAVKIALL